DHNICGFVSSIVNHQVFRRRNKGNAVLTVFSDCADCVLLNVCVCICRNQKADVNVFTRSEQIQTSHVFAVYQLIVGVNTTSQLDKEASTFQVGNCCHCTGRQTLDILRYLEFTVDRRNFQNRV